MIKLKNILLEKDDKPDSENPNKILVKNKESGKSYYISKDSFDPSVHEKSEPTEKKKEEEPKKEPSDKKEKETPTVTSTDKSKSDTKSTKEKDSKEAKPEEKEKKLSPSEKLSQELGSFVFVDDKERQEIAKDTENLRPDLKNKLLSFEFTPFFREYDSLLDTLADQQNKKDNDGAKETVKVMRKIAKRIQGVAIAKLAALSPKEMDVKVISATKHFHNDSTNINQFLRRGDEINLSFDDLKKIMSVDGAKEKFPNEYKMYTILTMDNHFKSDNARLPNDTVVYRGIQKDVLQKFVEAGEWVDNGFVSTSLNPIIAEDFTDRELVSGERKKRTPVFKINLKRGDPVMSLPCSEDEYCIESEITLPRGCTFKITGKDENQNIYDVSVEFPNA